MKYTNCMFAVLIALTVTTTAFSEEVPTENDVLVFQAKTLGQAMGDIEHLLVSFCTPSNELCKRLEPEFNKAAAILKAEGSKIRLGKVDVAKETHVADVLKIDSVPTVKLFVKGDPLNYEGGPTGEDIVEWVKSKTQPTTKEISTDEELKKEISKNPYVVLFLGSTTDPEYKDFERISKYFEGHTFLYTTNNEVRTANKISEKTKLAVFKPFDEGMEEFEGEYAFDKIGKFIEDNSFPLVLDFDQNAAQRIFGGEGIPTIFFIHAGDEAGKKIEPIFREAALKLKRQIQFCIANIKDEDNGPALGIYLGLTEADTPTIRLLEPRKDTAPLKYSLEKEPTIDNIVEFFGNYKAGALKRWLRSDPIPEKNDGPVKIVVAKNWNDIVLDESKDVLIMFHAPWCAPCKQFEPVWERIAKRLSAVKDVVVAKMDGASNDVEGVDIMRYPTIKLYASLTKDYPVDFEGERTEQNLLTWFKERIT